MSSNKQGEKQAYKPGERADAARNRRQILAAAQTLFDNSPSESLTTDQIAAAAGVGKGTIFRRFGDYVGLVEALIRPGVTELRTAVESGPPPLGPGAPPEEALARFLDALLDFVWANKPVIRALEQRSAHAYYANPASQFWIAELSRRLTVAIPAIDPDYRAFALFPNLRADVLDYLENHQHMPRTRIRKGIHALARTSTTS